MITDKEIWDKLTAHGVVTCERPVKNETYKTACQYMTQKMLEHIVNDTGHDYANAHYVPEYRYCAEVELTERNLLGKKRLGLPV